jgi:hypothetical protein
LQREAGAHQHCRLPPVYYFFTSDKRVGDLMRERFEVDMKLAAVDPARMGRICPRLAAAGFQTQPAPRPDGAHPITEAAWVSTNAAAQWGIAAIQNLALVGDTLPTKG